MRSISACRPRRARTAAALLPVIVGAAIAGCSSGHPAASNHTTPGATSTPAPPPVPGAHSDGATYTLSRDCADPSYGNAEVTQATDPARGYLYDSWISCGAVAFARSVDGGRHFGAPFILPGSRHYGTVGLSDGPAIAVAPDGTVYVTFAMIDGRFPDPARMYPVVEVSTDYGRSFPRERLLAQHRYHDFADRPYITVDKQGSAYVTWDYSPDASRLTLAATSSGSGYFEAGDLNIVVQKSTNQGRRWGPMRYVAKGADVGKIITEPDGRLGILYLGHHFSADGRYLLSPGNEYFTSSADGGLHWSQPVQVGTAAGSVALNTWWIDCALAADPAGYLYASWDTQVSGRDESWLAYSTDGGTRWSAPVQVTTPTPERAHILDLAGGWPGVVYVAWLTGGYGHAYADYLRPYSIAHGWLSAPIQVSRVGGMSSVWPGDTIGVSVLPTPGTGQRVLLSWGSAPLSASDIYFSSVSFARAISPRK